MTLTQTSTISGVPLRTLQRWRTSKPWIFAAVCEKASKEQLITSIVTIKNIILAIQYPDGTCMPYTTEKFKE